MTKLDPAQIQYTIDQKDKGKSTRDIALEMKVCGEVDLKDVCKVPPNWKSSRVRKAETSESLSWI